MPKNALPLNENRENDMIEMETAGLSILDPKRRRVEDPIMERPNNT